LDVDKYKDYSPIFLSTTFALQYGLSFAATIALVVHTALYHGKDLWKRLINSKAEPKDIHGKLYETYAPVPIWWFLVLNAIMIVIGFVCVLMWDTQLPWWGYILALAVAGFFLVCHRISVLGFSLTRIKDPSRSHCRYLRKLLDVFPPS
jgi:hypothetical protein